MNLRPYQIECVDDVVRAFDDHDSVLAVLATGLGKTVVFSKVIGRMLATGGRALVLAHREELVRQAADKIEKVTGLAPEIEMAELRANEYGFRRAPVVVSSVQTLTSGRGAKRRMHRFDAQHFRLVVADEAHHAVSKSWRSCIEHFSQHGAKVLGVTATPDRGDNMAMGQLFQHVAKDYGILDAVRDGWLVRPLQHMVEVKDLDFSEIRTKAGDLDGAALAETLSYEKTLHGMVYPTIEQAGDRPTLIFAASIAHAERVTEIINRHAKGRAEIITGGTPKDQRRDLIRRYAAGEFQYLVNVGVATEGFDAPHVSCVAMMRPTKSRALYSQILGRGTRPEPGCVDGPETPQARRDAIAASGKPDVLVLDYVGNAGRHKLVHASDVLSGKLPKDIVERAKAKQKDSDDPVDVVESLEDERQAEIERRRQMDARKRQHIVATARYESTEVDPFAAMDLRPTRQPPWRKNKPASEKQRAFLASRNVPVPTHLNMADACSLIDGIKKREASAPPTPKQAWFLKTHGVPVPATKKEASKLIGEMKRQEAPA